VIEFCSVVAAVFSCACSVLPTFGELKNDIHNDKHLLTFTNKKSAVIMPVTASKGEE